MAEHKSFWRSSQGLASLVLIGAVSYFLLMEHRQHTFQALPFLIILLCPLMHLFMHGGHGGHQHTDDEHDAYQRKQALEENAAWKEDT